MSIDFTHQIFSACCLLKASKEVKCPQERRRGR